MNFFERDKFLLALKALVFVLMSWFIINTLFVRNDFAQQWQVFVQNLKGAKAYVPVLLVLLMPLNWFLEAMKWRLLMKEDWSEMPALMKGVLAGVTFGFITPGRSGEFVGRVMFSKREEKAKSFYLSSIGGIAQMAVTVAFGAILIQGWLADVFISGIVTGVAIVFLLLYFRFDWLNSFLLSITKLQQYNLTINNSELPPVNVLLKVLGLSALRYGVYLLQYVLAFAFMGVSTNWVLLLTHSGTLLLLQSFSPLMPLLDVSFRGGAALYVYSQVAANGIAVVSAALLVWLVNLVIPALAGYVFILRYRKRA